MPFAEVIYKAFPLSSSLLYAKFDQFSGLLWKIEKMPNAMGTVLSSVADVKPMKGTKMRKIVFNGYQHLLHRIFYALAENSHYHDLPIIETDRN